MGTVTLKWTDHSVSETEQRIYRSTEPFDQHNLPPILTTLEPNIEEYKDETVLEGLKYYYMVSSYQAIPTLEKFSALIEVDTSFSLGPGSNEIVYGDAAQGFFGEVPVDELISGSDLASLIKLTATMQNTSQPWLKFVLDGKILYVAKYPFAHSLLWNSINGVDAVFGNRVIEIKKHLFKIRLLKGINPDSSVTPSSGDLVQYTADSEWNRLFYPLSKTTTTVNTLPKWNIYTDSELGLTSNNGKATWCQEIYHGTARRVLRGNSGVFAIGSDIPNGSNSVFGWRPVLELIP